MTPCEQSGCRHLEVRCKDCGKSAGKMILPDDRWISCKDRLPERGDEIIVFAPMGEHLNFRTVIQYFGRLNSSITHWMPLPTPPRE